MLNITLEEAKKELHLLEIKTAKWAHEYYGNDAPSVSDEEYDGAYIRINELIKEFPELSNKDSIINKVGYAVDNRFKKVLHSHKMLSLSNAFNKEDLFKFDTQIKKAVDTKFGGYVTELKIDGLSIALRYENGKLIQGLTRGDGQTGEDVTHNVLTIKDIPKTISYQNTFEVRGEVFMLDSVFDELQKENNFANPRNAAAGSIRQKNSEVTKTRKLSSFMYQIPNPLDHNLKTHNEVLTFLNEQGFATNKETKFVKTIDQVIEEVHKFEGVKKTLGYATDGVVIKVNNNTSYEDIGHTIKFPKYMIAYKFPEEQVVTTLEDIFMTIGRTGRVTYNAKLSPVRIAGSTVSAATLHNADYVREIKINIGDKVVIKKAGEIIPKVLGVSGTPQEKEWQEETKCSICDSILIRHENEVDQYCPNIDGCPAIKQAMIEHFVSRQAMNIEGVSSEIIRTFVSNGFIKESKDLFTLEQHKEQILALPGFKEKSVNKILLAIKSSKSCKLENVLFGLGIRYLGKKNSIILARRFSTMEAITSTTYDELFLIRELGPKVSSSVVNYFSNPENVSNIKSMNLDIQENDKIVSSIFSNKTFVITGTLSKSRTNFSKIVELNGGNVSSAISSKTSYLLAGEKAGSKLAKANKLGVEVLNEIQFNKMVGGSNE